jgi:SAM-dependent methyltransferase
MTQRRFWDLLIASFGALFFEMLLVRWLPTTIYYLGYYKNCILFATFLGFGCGSATRRRVDRVVPYFALFVAAAVLAAVITEHYTRIVPLATGEFLWSQAKTASVAVPILILLLVVFVISALLMMPIGRLVGNHLEAFPPITAYSINIAASLLGVLSFLVLSYLRFGPAAWFTIAVLPILYFVRGNRLGIICNLAGLLLAVGILQFFRSPQEYWSPYSKITLEEPFLPINARLLLTNNNGHQVLYDLSPERLVSRGSSQNPEALAEAVTSDASAPGSGSEARARPSVWDLAQTHQYMYESAYEILQPRSVLIVGGGTGNEAAAALRRGAERVDVVEIDPVIIAIGRTFHPERPYRDSRVRVINDDARHYMATTHERYDLVIFGFLDSTSHLSGMSNIRLDNYVYTVESFRQARSLLEPGGLLQVTYYAVADFVRLRIFLMIEEAFGEAPLITQLSLFPSADVIFFAGPAVSKTSQLSLPGLLQKTYGHEFSAVTRRALAATDDWPYLNVRTRSIGRDYLLGLASMVLISFLFIRGFVWSGTMPTRDTASGWCFFLQGAGFMLLETNTITRMALILGSTWIVTSFAVILVLLAALVSNVVVQRSTFPSVPAGIAMLAIAALLNYVVDIHTYLALARWFRTPLAALQVYLPILASSLVFGRLFQRSDKSSYDFGMNILGAVFGGMIEYSSLIVGIRTVYLLALVLFLAVLLPYRRMAAEDSRDELLSRAFAGPG